MKTIPFKDVLNLGIKTVKVITDGYESKGILSHWEPFRTARTILFNVDTEDGILEHEWLFVSESEDFTLEDDGTVSLYYPESIKEKTIRG